jgi:hypothetical protein
MIGFYSRAESGITNHGNFPAIEISPAAPAVAGIPDIEFTVIFDRVGLGERGVRLRIRQTIRGIMADDVKPGERKFTRAA